MEIISYVNDKPHSRGSGFRGILFSNFEPKFKNHKSRVKTKTASVTYMPYRPELELRTFTAQKVKRAPTIQNFFKAVGSGVTVSVEFISTNFKKIVIFAAVIAAAIGLSAAAYFVRNRAVNYTGPLTLETGESLDIENLNKLMAKFALEDTVEIDDEGNLVDSPVSVAQLFTQPVTYQYYKVKSGDTIGGITGRFGLRNISTLISINDIGNVRQLAAGQKLKIPSIDGIVYTVKAGDSLNSIVTKYNVKLSELLDVNELTSETLTVGQVLFIPGAALDSSTLKSAMGDMFKLPIQAKFRWSSPYGSRIDPIAGVQSFHTGTDMACPTGTPIYAAMSGKVTTTGVTRVYGNYVIIDHGNGYQTLYAHMSKIIAKKGQWVSPGTRIGLVGSTGYSTGPHLHFTVYKNGKLINPMTVLK